MANEIERDTDGLQKGSGK